MIERYESIGKPFNFSPKTWIGITLGGDVQDEDIKRLVTDSYNIARERMRATGSIRGQSTSRPKKHALDGVMAQNTADTANQKKVWGTGNQKINE